MGAWKRILDRIAVAAKKLTSRAHRTPRHWPNLAPPEPIPANAADHAEQFALTWYDHLESLIKKRLRELGIPDRQIGAFDHDFDLRLAAFHPKERTGGGISPGARINLNSGVFNPDLLVPHPSPTVSSVWGKARLRDRCDAVIAHEYHEGQGVSHSEAERRAADTELRITDGARRNLRAMAERER
jgi:hypothetical protein